LLYGGLFLAAGAILLAITYGLVAHSLPNVRTVSFGVSGTTKPPQLPPPLQLPAKGSGAIYLSRNPNGSIVKFRAYAGKVNQTFRAVTANAKAALNHQQSVELDSLLTKSGIALAIMAFASIGLGWLMAGRALRPVRTMSARARGISERNLHERLALDGPNDELKELGNTFDELLARLEKAFESQRRFVSNASHELRTPITLERTLVEVALADPEPSVESLRDTCRRVLAAGQQQERLIEALLTLARSQRGIASREQLDLGAIAAEVIAATDLGGVRLERRLGIAPTAGDQRLVERLVANLLDNALKYNDDDGWVAVWTDVRNGAPTIEVANTGPVVGAEQIGGLLEPFRRLNRDRSNPNGDRSINHDGGLGLGLSIVEAIATAHGARLSATPRPEGGLLVRVSFPARPGLSLD
jgi:signal transduction histidine kinase